MKEKYLRVYKLLDVLSIKKNLLIYGALSGQCANCQALEIKLDSSACPQCRADFQYISFRDIRSHLPKLAKLTAQRPQVKFIDHEDFQRNLAAVKAQEFLK